MNKQAIIDLHNTKRRNLETIHEALGIKQSLANYEKNSTKKYGRYMNREELLTQEEFDLVVINTMAKLRRHTDEAYYIRLVKSLERETALKSKVVYVENPTTEKAKKYAELGNLADKIAELAAIAAEYELNDTDVVNHYVDNNETNSKYMTSSGKTELFFDKVKMLVEIYEGKK